MTPIYPNGDSQEAKVLEVLLLSKGSWINKQYFVRTLYLTQAGRALWNLENKFHWKIEHSPFTDEHKFRSYRILQEGQLKLI